MKKIFFVSFILSLLFISCEDVINVDLETASPKLVIDASIDWEKGTAGNEQIIKLSTTSDFYSNAFVSASGATIFITNSSNTIFDFIETVPNSGNYICSNFIPVIDETYILTVTYQGQTYTASEKMIAVPEIIRAEQRIIDEGAGEQIEVEFFFQDNGLEDNNYMFRYIVPGFITPIFEAFDDRFQQGNEMSNFYSDDKLKTGDVINFTLYGISRQNYNYMNILLGITGGGGPFSTPPATLRGNIINQTDEDNFCFGFFRLSEIDRLDYTVQ
ncbi:DUF4249 family protein [Flavobacterium macrobrachii]|uniref:DUF4249 family protein n=1 Tax=Flavobacterium macrobrachii TaxID=591204 RepID=UPI003F71C544